MEEQVQYHTYPQSTALTIFLPLLKAHLPKSNSMYYRIKAPHNIPSRHCLFAATFPPNAIPFPDSCVNPPPSQIWTMIFSDRSQHVNCQVWMFCSLDSSPIPLSDKQQALVGNQLQSALQLIKDTSIPQAPGWPFKPILRIGYVLPALYKPLVSFASSKRALIRHPKRQTWILRLPPSSFYTLPKPELPPNMKFTCVDDNHIETVIKTSAIERQPDSLLLQPNVAILNMASDEDEAEGQQEGKLVAWMYMGIDGSLATLYVRDECRGRGLGTCVAKELIRRWARGEFKEMGYGNETGLMYAEAQAYGQLSMSEEMMRTEGFEMAWESWDVDVDLRKF